ncbi:hypothetical protein LMG9446_0460 [Lactococcus lactis subsp. lactis]|nr:hypothetical protein LMG9446_0460 [Lactococcus lactis subsp. lactis]
MYFFRDEALNYRKNIKKSEAKIFKRNKVHDFKHIHLALESKKRAPSGKPIVKL